MRVGELLAAVVVVSVSAGCSCSQVNSGPVPLEKIGEAYVDDLCRVLLRCYPSTFLYCDQAHCTADQAPLGLDQLLAEVDAGWVRYDAAAAGLCSTHYATAPCSEFSFFFIPEVGPALARCSGVLTGLRTDGQSCVWSGDCAGGSCVGATCPGTCRAYLQEGAACTIDSSSPDCDPGKSLACRGGTCKGPWKAGDSCASLADCYPDFWCQLDAGTCRGLATEGQPCSQSSDAPRCVKDLWCSSRFGTGTCQQRVSTPGGACLDDTSCVAGLSCVPDGGSIIGVECRMPGTLGAPCDTLSDCATGLSCSGSGCVARPGRGEMCRTGVFSTPCQDGLVCDGTVCGDPLCPGKPCSADGGACTEGVCRSGACSAHLALGQPCTAAGECASGSCQMGVCSDPNTCRP